MKREEKYLVFKLDDLCEHLTTEEHTQLMAIILKVNGGRALAGKKLRKYVCVADNWPMYEDTWLAIEQWGEHAKTTNR